VKTGQSKAGRVRGELDVYVDERDAGVIRRDEGWATMSSKAEGKAQDPRLSLGDFIVELESSGVGPVDTDLCRRLWTECAGRARFAEAVLRAAAAAGVSVDPESSVFADWVVELCPRLSLALGSGDTARRLRCSLNSAPCQRRPLFGR
jgi:hypothetical protein